MKTLYLECKMGAAGDMLMAALSELVDKNAFLEKMNALGLPGITVTAEDAETCGIHGTHMRVLIGGEEEVSRDVNLASEAIHTHTHEHEEEHHEHSHTHEHIHDHEHEHSHEHEHEHHHEHHHHHTSMADIRHIVSHLNVSETVKNNVLAVYEKIAEAESHAHGAPVDQIHFHEVGSMDAVADITGVCLLMEMIGADEVVISPVHVGSGHVHCAHGILPVPAPATAYLLQGVPSYGGSIQGELCTPTGAALLKQFATRFGEMPVMATEKIGYGIGSKVFPAANCLRAFLGESGENGDRISGLSCNIDDMTGEEIGAATAALMEAGALEVFTQAVQMKKNRPGVLLTCFCRPEEEEKFAALIFKYTTTIGIRKTGFDRYTLSRREETLQTAYGPVRAKVSTGYGVTRIKPESDDLNAIAKKEGLSVREVKESIKN